MRRVPCRDMPPSSSYRKLLSATTAFLYVGLLLCILLPSLCSAGMGNIPYYRSEPTIRTPEIKILKYENDSSINPGYIFLDPRYGGLIRPGPYMIDQNGELVFWGQSFMRKQVERSQNFRVCDYLGQKGTHLCWSEIADNLHSLNRVFDNTYKQVGGGDFSKESKSFHYPNPHEFNEVDEGNSFVQAVWPYRKADLTPYNGPEGGKFIDSCFQEVEFATRREVFRWCASAHFPLWVTQFYLRDNGVNLTWHRAATGKPKHPWDWGHMNAIDKNKHGDYLLSIRHWNTIVKVAGNNAKTLHGVEPGTVLWKLGGKNSTFEIPDKDDFAMQHHVRFVNETANTTTISFYNNNNNPIPAGNFTKQQRRTDARIMMLDHSTNKSWALRQYHFPEEFIPDKFPHANAQGSVSVMPNDNVWVGWGAMPFWGEMDKDGRLLYLGHHGNSNRSRMATYRVYKQVWKGFPHWDPKLLVYSRSCGESPIVAYVSWNGATEVRSWRFSISTHNRHGPWFEVGNYQKKGFETKVILSESTSVAHVAQLGFIHHVRVEAIDESGKILGNQTTQTWVPNRKALNSLKHCNDDGCDEDERFDYDLRYSNGQACVKMSILPGLVAVILSALMVESWMYMYYLLYDIPLEMLYFSVDQ